MRRIAFVLIVFVVVLPFADGSVSGAPESRSSAAAKVVIDESTGKIELGVFYAGRPGSGRQKDFAGFLGERFARVKSGDLAVFKEGVAAGFDVVIFDYDGDGFKAPRPDIRADYAKAAVTLGVIGSLICDGQGLKTGYL